MKGPSPGFSRKEVLTVAAIIVALGSLYFAFSAVRAIPKPRMARERAARMAQAIEAYQALTNSLPVDKRYNPWTDAEGAYQNCVVVGHLNGLMRPNLLLMEQRELNAKGSFVDPWGRPYRALFWRGPGPSFAQQFAVYSCGPNEKWEQGEGDDIGGGF